MPRGDERTNRASPGAIVEPAAVPKNASVHENRVRPRRGALAAQQLGEGNRREQLDAGERDAHAGTEDGEPAQRSRPSGQAHAGADRRRHPGQHLAERRLDVARRVVHPADERDRVDEPDGGGRGKGSDRLMTAPCRVHRHEEASAPPGQRPDPEPAGLYRLAAGDPGWRSACGSTGARPRRTGLQRSGVQRLGQSADERAGGERRPAEAEHEVLDDEQRRRRDQDGPTADHVSHTAGGQLEAAVVML